jgi:polyhydroxybutyrate depolymerase
MKRVLPFVFLFLPFVSSAQLTTETIDIVGTSRTFKQYLPTGYTPGENLPVVIVLHGIGDNANNMSNVGFNQIADTARFIPVYLQGETNGWGQTSWNNGTALGSTEDDVFFISEVIDRLEDSIDVDLSRVYMTGFSMGSIMTYTCISEMSDRIAAIACFSGTMSSQEIASTGYEYPVPAIHFHGTADGTVPYESGALPSLSLVPQTLDKLKSINGWAGDSTIVAIPDNASDGITIEKIVYNCTTPLEHWKMTGADHIWPYQPANDTMGIYVAWHWFSQFQHPNPSTASISESKDFTFSVYPNPVSDEMTIKYDVSKESQTTISLLDISGKTIDVLLNNNAPSGKKVMSYSTSHLAQGIYFLKVESGGYVKTTKIVKR